jgi:flagella basal body P-ring formation protein FlgA
MLEKTPVVERGDVVTIMAAGGNLQVTVPGIVKETGFEGDLVKVQNSMSRKEIFARVVDSSTVAVHF